MVSDARSRKVQARDEGHLERGCKRPRGLEETRLRSAMKIRTGSARAVGISTVYKIAGKVL